jgi:sugar phosphate isomerase/epimerase
MDSNEIDYDRELDYSDEYDELDEIRKIAEECGIDTSESDWLEQYEAMDDDIREEQDLERWLAGA